MVRSKALWSFNRYIISRDVWKSVFVPALTYGNASLVLGGDVERKLEVMQREVERFSLGCRFTCSREFLQGEVNMSSFKFREAQAKLSYDIRLGKIGEDRWAAKLQKIKRLERIKTKWDRRLEYCGRLIGYNKREWEDAELDVAEVKGIVKQRQLEKWTENMAVKSSMEVYRMGKKEWGGVDRLYDNSRGSGFLADARAGMLDTGVYRRHFEDVSGICDLCGEGEETVEHVVVACASLGVRDVSLNTALGFGDEIVVNMSAGWLCGIRVGLPMR